MSEPARPETSPQQRTNLRVRWAVLLAALLVFVLGLVGADFALAQMSGDTADATMRERWTFAAILLSLVGPWLLLAIASIYMPGAPVAIGAAAIITYDLFALGRIASDIEHFSEELGIADKLAGHLSDVGVQALGASIAICLVVMVARGNWPTFVAAAGALMVGLAVLLAVFLTFQPDPVDDAKVARVQVDGQYIGPTMTNGATVTVVFVVPKLDDDGKVVGMEPKVHAAKVADNTLCAEDQNPCSIHVTLETGGKDAGLASWLADAVAAGKNVTIVGPTSTWQPAGSAR